MENIRGGPVVGRTVPVTGASSGIGRATALGLATMGAHVATTGRDPLRRQDAAREIGAAGVMKVEVFVADPFQAQVRRLARRVLAGLPRIDVLVNTAGGYWDTRQATVDGLGYTFAVNHLASFLLTNLLRDRLEWSAPARVVTVASNAHATVRIDSDDLQGELSYSGGRAYSPSKLANVLFTYQLARRMRGSAVTADALHPGVVRTSFGTEDPARIQRLLVPLLRPVMTSPHRGAATSIHLASALGLEQVSGCYFAHRRPLKSSARSHDQAVAARLWEASADRVGLSAASRV